MAILFFDTETTGVPDYNAPLSATALQPHIVQLAALLTDDGAEEKASINFIVNPGVSIPQAASNVHGITDDIAKIYGIHPKLAAAAFRGLVARADIICAHHIKFDLFVTDVLFVRHAMTSAVIAAQFCTMEASASIVNLPPTERMIAAGFNKPKTPSLAEAYQYFFGRDLVGAHDALADVRACKDIYFALQRAVAE